VKGAKWPEESFAAHALTSTVAGAIIFFSFLKLARTEPGFQSLSSSW